ncbi:olfactory receptor class A-like protein 1 [Rhinatrema bivittatum]|uniref:olfactory receptor class A-like protein 1 n=1 Tax=Rhinatrema bivittatum TaxID=194408 RepID=UPI00112B0BF0|nr:olfactory receptor class A-like protein 1 [Rhinatrema bivittatum]
MDLLSTIKVIFFLLQTSIGALGNAFILIAYAHIAHTEKDLKPIDTVLCHLVFANMLGLLIRIPPQIMKDFGFKYFLDDIGCKLVLYVYRTARGVSICVTSLLSIIQAITLAPARWSPFKSRAQKYITPHIIGFWLFNMALYVEFSLKTFAPRNGTNLKAIFHNGICYTIYRGPKFFSIYLLTISGHDSFFVGLMLLSSVYILYVLKRHRDKMQYVRSTSQNPNETAERKAAKSVIKLVTLYVFFYGVDTFLMVYSNSLYNIPFLLSEVRLFISCCYALFSPFLIISFNKKILGKLKFSQKEGKITTIDTKAHHQKM